MYLYDVLFIPGLFWRERIIRHPSQSSRWLAPAVPVDGGWHAPVALPPLLGGMGHNGKMFFRSSPTPHIPQVAENQPFVSKGRRGRKKK